MKKLAEGTSVNHKAYTHAFGNRTVYDTQDNWE